MKLKFNHCMYLVTNPIKQRIYLSLSIPFWFPFSLRWHHTSFAHFGRLFWLNAENNSTVRHLLFFYY